MRKIAIVGSGQAGLLAAHDLLRHGFEVTLFSDKTPDQWLYHSRPTGTPVRFGKALDYERELGLNFWEDFAPKVEGAMVSLGNRRGKQIVALHGLLKQPLMAIDLRLQCSKWLAEFENRGGIIHWENVSTDRLDEISSHFHLTIVATGRGELAHLFARNPQRSVYDHPKRHLAAFIVSGPPVDLIETPYIPSRMNIIASVGEVFIYPYLHKDCVTTWCILILAKPNGLLDQFQNERDGRKLLLKVKQEARQFIPWHAKLIDQFELADELAWLTGRITPIVREPVGRLPSGRIVTGIGDTLTSLDPIGGQGANLGNKAAKNLVECILRRGDGTFDDNWMSQTFENFYQRHGKPAITFNNVLLENMTKAGREIFIAQFGSNGRRDNLSGKQLLANAICNNFDDPTLYTECFYDLKKARELISRLTGRHWFYSAAEGRLRAIRKIVSDW